MLLKVENLIYRVKPPCPNCPHTLGQIHTFINPCLECKLNGYQMYEWFLREWLRLAEFNSEEKRC